MICFYNIRSQIPGLDKGQESNEVHLKSIKFQNIIKSLLLFVSVFLLFSCGSTKHILKPFHSDGCSLFPDQNLITHKDWSDCCLEHDIAYWRGGTKAQRVAADSLLRICVLKKTGSKKLADLMYKGVRIGGSPHFPTWYRWGYGWNYMRGYAPLTREERLMVIAGLKAIK